MKNSIIYILLLIIIFLSLFSTEAERRIYRLRIKEIILQNTNIPHIEYVPVFGDSECNSTKTNPDYEKYIQEHPKQSIEDCIKQKSLINPNLSKIHEINCRSNLNLPDPKAPPKTVPIKIFCRKWLGNNEVLKIFEIQWFKIRFHAFKNPI